MIETIKVEVIPHSLQRYPTCGDYWYPYDSSMRVKISKLGNSDFEFLVLIHELVEAHLCRKNGVDERDITKFDLAFEAARTPGSKAEPGDSPDAPYHVEHLIAGTIERQLASELGVSWDEYEAAINAL